MTLLSHTDLIHLIDTGVIDAPLSAVNQASIDVTLGPDILIETAHSITAPIIDLAQKQVPSMQLVTIDPVDGYIVRPGQFFLATTQETFNLPDDIVAEYVLKSSQARSGLFHALAGYCGPGWHGSKLTMEFHNVSQYHSLKIRRGMKCGQIKFYRVAPVPAHASYALKGQYNHQTTVTPSKGIR